MKKQIVIVTEKFDPHADTVIKELSKQKHDVIRLNTDEIPTNTAISYSVKYDIQQRIDILNSERQIDLDHIRSIWYRRVGSYVLPSDPIIQSFAFNEINHSIQSIWNFVDTYWMSFPSDISKASWKGAQLKKAVQVCFDVPKSLITNDPNVAKDFMESCNDSVIYKTFSPGFFQNAKESSPPTVVHTSLLSKQNLNDLNTIKEVSALFQEYIPKAYELRVTVVGDELFAAKIYSQESHIGKVDWRKDTNIRFEIAELPTNIQEMCINFVKSYNLNYSALDFIVTPEDQYIFLENNPGGQFLFVEYKVPSLRIVEALTACLIRGNNS